MKHTITAIAATIALSIPTMVSAEINCAAFENAARQTMNARQSGVSAQFAMDQLPTDSHPLVELIVVKAWRVPIQDSTEDKERIVDLYAAKWESACEGSAK